MYIVEVNSYATVAVQMQSTRYVIHTTIMV